MMRQDFRRFAPFGLYLAGLALLVSGVLYIIQHSFTLPLQISLAAIVLGLALFALLDPVRTKEALTGRQARYGSNALVLSLAFIGILVVINYLAYQNTRRWDLTEDQQNTLAPETVQALDSLKDPVNAEAFFSSRFPATTAQDLLENFKQNSKGKFDYTIIDPEKDPIRTQQANVTRDGTIVLTQADRQEQVSYVSENEITAALIRLTNPGKRNVYFLTGHGEYSLDGTDQNSYPEVKNSLTAKNYTVTTLNLMADTKIPEDALAVIVAGATKPLSDREVQAISDYLDKGGSLMYLAEPTPITKFGDAADPMAAYLEKNWGIKLDNDLIIDRNNPQQPLIAVASQFGDHAITQKMYSLGVLFPTARSIQANAPSQDIQLTPLAFTTQMAWGETNFESVQNQQVTEDQGQDIPGPLTLAVAGTNNTTKARIFVSGDSDFASSQYFQLYGNGDFLLNAIDWSAEQDNLISLTPKTPTQRFMVLPQRYTMGLILFGSVFFLPGLVLLTGITVWMQRRRRG